VRKFAKLALNANPNILEILWSPIGSARTALGQRLFEIRGAFLSKKCHKSYGGYALSQLHKLRGQVEKEGRVRKWKHGAHLIRLLRMGCEILETGEVNIDRRGIDADELRAIRSGSYEYARVVGMADELDARLKAAAASSTLPDQPRTFMVENSSCWPWDQSSRRPPNMRALTTLFAVLMLTMLAVPAVANPPYHPNPAQNDARLYHGDDGNTYITWIQDGVRQWLELDGQYFNNIEEWGEALRLENVAAYILSILHGVHPAEPESTRHAMEDHIRGGVIESWNPETGNGTMTSSDGKTYTISGGESGETYVITGHGKNVTITNQG
jgi:hypothetical protein